MVYYFDSAADEKAVIYMGKDKFENEELLKNAFPTDIWFHVDDLSSAHVYLRSQYNIDNIPLDLLEDVMQLTKHNSIQGNKLASCKICYTIVTNISKTGDMDIGTVSFKNSKLVKKQRVDKEKFIINRLNKTKREEYPDLHRMLVEHQSALKRDKDKLNPKYKPEVVKVTGDTSKQKLTRLTGYEEVHKEENMYSNKGLSHKTANELDEDFM